jgi:hypothetical protein
MGGYESFQETSSQPRPTWVDNFHYDDLFSKSVTIAGDPEVLLVTGILYQNGTIDLQPWYHLPSGLPDTTTPGSEYEITAFDASGNAVAEVSFPVSFSVYFEPIGVQPTDSVPMVEALPYPTTAMSVAISHNGQVITHVNVSSKLLSDAIRSIPNGAFRREANEHKQELLEKVREVERQLAAKDLRRAIADLRELHRELDRELLDEFPVASPLESTKTQILDLVRDQIKRLKAQFPQDADDEEEERPRH